MAKEFNRLEVFLSDVLPKKLLNFVLNFCSFLHFHEEFHKLPEKDLDHNHLIGLPEGWGVDFQFHEPREHVVVLSSLQDGEHFCDEGLQVVDQ